MHDPPDRAHETPVPEVHSTWYTPLPSPPPLARPEALQAEQRDAVAASASNFIRRWSEAATDRVPLAAPQET